MTVIKEEVFTEIMLNPSHARHNALAQQVASSLNLLRYDYTYGRSINDFVAPVDRASCVAMLEQIKDYAARVGRLGGKALRPHSFDTFDYLDRTQPWWGFEFEMGFQSHEARSRTIEAAWEIGVNGVTFDGEGEGNYECEITFAPETMDNFLSEEAPAARFMQYVSDHGEDMYHGGSWGIGTHLNISLPGGMGGSIAPILNNSVALLPEVDPVTNLNVRGEWIGRSHIYAGFFTRNALGNTWVEGKIFRTTYNIERFRKYVAVAKALTKIALLSQDRNPDEGVTNLLDMIKDETVEPIFIRNVNLIGVSDPEYVSGSMRNQSQFNRHGYTYTATDVNPFA